MGNGVKTLLAACATLAAWPCPGAGGAPLSATVSTTLGDIVIELRAEDAPRAVGNFVALARSGFYDGTAFHVIVPGFMVQAGGPKDEPARGPGYCFDDEASVRMHHDLPGIVSMANTGPNTNGSQFMILLAPARQLDGKQTAFGRVTGGMPVVERLGKIRVEKGRPVETVSVRSVTISGGPPPPQPATRRELPSAELARLADAGAREVLTKLGTALGLGALDRFGVDRAMSRCTTGELSYRADFAQAKGASLRLYGQVEAEHFTIRQLAFGRAP